MLAPELLHNFWVVAVHQVSMAQLPFLQYSQGVFRCVSACLDKMTKAYLTVNKLT
jgi:hypothetical protein